MTQAINTQAVKPAGFLDRVYDAGAKSTNWLGRSVQSAANGASQTLRNVWDATRTFFARLMVRLGAAFAATKSAVSEGFFKARAAVAAMPRETKIMAAIGAGATALAGLVCWKCCGKTEKAEDKKEENKEAAPSSKPADTTVAQAPAATQNADTAVAQAPAATQNADTAVAQAPAVTQTADTAAAQAPAPATQAA